MKMDALNTVFLTGYAQAPKGTRLFDAGAMIGVMLEVEKDSHEIVNADCTFVTGLAKDYFTRLVVGYNLKEDIEELVQLVHDNMFIPSAQSVMVALRIAHQRYLDNITKK